MRRPGRGQDMTEARRPTIGRFQLESELGRGYHGRVFLAWDPDLERKVALKVILGPARHDEQFMREVRAVSRLSHPNIIPLYERGSQSGKPYLVFEYVEGALLRDELVRLRPLDEARALDFLSQMLEGMAAAHAEGVAHLDLSPANLMLDTQGRIRIMDFGLARLVSQDHVHDADKARGTPRYMSPEHFAGKPLDLRTDVFALGLIGYELLAGSAAADGEGLASVREAIVNASFNWRCFERAGSNPQVVQVLREALAREPTARYADAGEMLDALRAARAVQAAPDGRQLAAQFLLRRLQRRPEFPAFSNNLHEMNRLTAEDSTAGLEDLAKVVQRDFSLASRLMKIANSAFFNRTPGGVATLGNAISQVGTRVVRMLCNGLVVFDRLNDGRTELEDALVGSFVAALMARTLGLVGGRDASEEGFICALFHRLGRNLVLYYLDAEHADILELVGQGMGRQQAEQQILGATCAELGAEIARHWKFPADIVDSMLPVPGMWLETLHAGALTRGQWLRLVAQLSSELCELAQQQTEAPWPQLEEAVARYASVMPISGERAGELLAGALEGFMELATVLGVNVARSGFCQRTARFLALMQDSPPA